METLVVVGLLLVLVAAFSPKLYALYGRVQKKTRELEFWRALKRRGLGPLDTAQDLPALELALRRCRFCPNVRACGEWLEAGEHAGRHDFCPNTPYFERLERL
jgi:hypothetical protein